MGRGNLITCGREKKKKSKRPPEEMQRRPEEGPCQGGKRKERTFVPEGKPGKAISEEGDGEGEGKGDLPKDTP